jgi:hypothetical protein
MEISRVLNESLRFSSSRHLKRNYGRHLELIIPVGSAIAILPL